MQESLLQCSPLKFGKAFFGKQNVFLLSAAPRLTALQNIEKAPTLDLDLLPVQAWLFLLPMMFFWAVLGLSAILARASPLPPTQCDGLNCFVILTSAHDAHDWTPQQLASAVPAKLLEIEVDAHSNLTSTSAGCTDPVQLNASSCMEQGLPCAGMGKGHFTSPYPPYAASCSGSFIADGHGCCADGGALLHGKAGCLELRHDLLP